MLKNLITKKIAAALVAAPLLLASATPALAQHGRHDRFNRGAYQGGRGGYYGGGGYDRRYDDRHRGGIGPGKGALIGGAGGAALGAIFGGGAKGALIGGAAGAGIGAIAGQANANGRHRREDRYYGRY